MKPLFISNVCRLNADQLDQIHPLATSPGVHPIPPDMLPPRQVRVTNQAVGFTATMKFHRDAFIPTIDRETAEELVTMGDGEYCEQKLLCYSMKDYIADPDVQKDFAELEKAKNAAAQGAEVAIVAIIGDNRSPLSVCRNIVSGCQKPESLEADAKGAIEAASVFLIED